jgi:hypothetical protein
LYSQRRRFLIGATVAAAATVVIAGCSSSSSKSSSSVNSGGSSSATTAAPSSSGGNTELHSLIESVQNGQHATFKAVYTANESGGTATTVTIEQKPPKSLFSTGDGEAISNGSTTYFCSGTGASKQCVSESGPNPLAGLVTLFSPTTAITAMQQAETELGAHLAGYNATFSTQTFAGQASNCLNLTASGVTAKYCVTKDGILAYEGAAGSNFQLTSYSTAVSDSDFSVGSVTTIPSGITIPGGGTLPGGG